MVVTFVHVWVKPDHIQDFIEACKLNHAEAVKEPGNLRFDILQDASDPSKFTLYEAYQSEEASKAHKNTRHYEVWRNTVSEWMAKPREGVRHLIIAPSDPAQW